MDYIKGQIESGYLTINELNKIVSECRAMASKLDLSIRWRICERTATAMLKWNVRSILWRGQFTHDSPHLVICLMYHGVYNELKRRTEENRLSILRMRQIEDERNRERQVMNMPDWSQRNNHGK